MTRRQEADIEYNNYTTFSIHLMESWNIGKSLHLTRRRHLHFNLSAWSHMANLG